MEGGSHTLEIPIYLSPSMGFQGYGFHPSTLPSTLQILYIFYINFLLDLKKIY